MGRFLAVANDIGEHQLQAVLLVHVRGGGVIIDRGDIGFGVESE
jgi:hypothetical protein